MEQLGGSMKCTVTREHATYTTNFIRGNLDTALETLGSVIKNTDFKRWEVADQKARMELDLAVLKTKPESSKSSTNGMGFIVDY
jgi:predicted Zn-dependent peptidase